MNKIQPINCQATSNLTVRIPDADKHYIVLYFYPKDATSGCTTEGGDFRDNHPAFLAANAVIYGVSRDSLPSHERFKSKQNFPFELISDPDSVLCNVFNVIQLKKNFGKEYMGIVRSTFLIDAEGNILKHWDKVKVKGHVDEVLATLKAL